MIKIAQHVNIRWIIRRDLERVLEIEKLSFNQPWTREDFVEQLRQKNCRGMVVESDGITIGYMICGYTQSTIEIITLAVHPDYRRRGVGTQMIDHIAEGLQMMDKIETVIGESNLQAQLFFRSNEFQAVQLLPHYFEDTGEDGYLMELRVAAEEEIAA